MTFKAVIMGGNDGFAAIRMGLGCIGSQVHDPFAKLNRGPGDIALNTAADTLLGNPGITIGSFVDDSISITPIPCALWLLGPGLLSVVTVRKSVKA